MDIQILVKHIAGSRSYGTNTPSSDLDIRGIYLPKKEEYLSCFNPIKEKVEEGDVKYWDLKQFIKLAVKGSPNILETLWVKEEFILSTSQQYIQLRENRTLFNSQRIRYTFLGFATSHREKFFSTIKQERGPNYKAAMHYIRVLRMGCELAEQGVLNVYRKDRDYLLEIREGKHTLNSLINSLINEGSALEQRLKEGFRKSSFPKEPDYDRLDELFLSIV